MEMVGYVMVIYDYVIPEYDRYLAYDDRCFKTGKRVRMCSYASFIVNNVLVCDEEKVKAQLEAAYRGAVLAEKEKSEWKS